MPLGYLTHDHHHPVAALHAHLPGDVGELVREAGEVPEGQAALLAVRAQPDHGRTIFLPLVHHVPAEVKPLGRSPLEVRVGRLVIAYVWHRSSLDLVSPAKVTSLVPHFTKLAASTRRLPINWWPQVRALWRNSDGAGGNSWGGANTFRKVRRSALIPLRARVGRDGNKGGHRTLRRRGRRDRTLNLWHRGAGGSGADPLQASQLLCRPSLWPYHRDVEP